MHLLLSTASLSILSYEHTLNDPAILLWNDGQRADRHPAEEFLVVRSVLPFFSILVESSLDQNGQGLNGRNGVGTACLQVETCATLGG